MAKTAQKKKVKQPKRMKLPLRTAAAKTPDQIPMKIGRPFAKNPVAHSQSQSILRLKID